jgi:hypothetical protein
MQSFDEKVQREPETTHDDPNFYYYGHIRRHYVIALRPPSIGTVIMAHCPNYTFQTFQSIRFALMAGVGEAIPNHDHDIRLGDVVVSMPTEGSPGVVQHDFGRREEGNFKLVGCLPPPPTALQNADNALNDDERL